MVKLKVLKSFYDKEKLITYHIDEVIEVSEKRASEILSHPLELAEKVEEVVEKEKTVTTENVITEQPKRKRKSN
jgi:hypothetical protein